MTTDTPLFLQAVAETGINPEPIYQRCKVLTVFIYGKTPIGHTTKVTTPRVGQKPIRKRK
jgi:hypothetical protein